MKIGEPINRRFNIDDFIVTLYERNFYATYMEVRVQMNDTIVRLELLNVEYSTQINKFQ